MPWKRSSQLSYSPVVYHERGPKDRVEWCARQDLNLRSPGPQPGVLSGLNYERALPDRTLSFPIPERKRSGGRAERGAHTPSFTSLHGKVEGIRRVRGRGNKGNKKRRPVLWDWSPSGRGGAEMGGASSKGWSAVRTEICCIRPPRPSVGWPREPVAPARPAAGGAPLLFSSSGSASWGHRPRYPSSFDPCDTSLKKRPRYQKPTVR